MTRPLTRPEDRPLSTRTHVIDATGHVIASADGIEGATARARELQGRAVAIVGEPDGIMLARCGHASNIVATVALRRWRERAASAA